MKYQTINEVTSAFLNGQIKFPDPIELAGVSFRVRSSSDFCFEELVSKKHKSVVMYEVVDSQQEQLKEANLQPWLLFVWKFDEGYNLVPAGVVSTSKTHIIGGSEEVIDEAFNEKNIIGDTVGVKFTSLPGSPALKGKVDTGADISSLHADKYSIQNGKIHFVCSKLSPNTISLPLHDHQAVKSAAGVQYRPVVMMNVKIGEKLLNNVLFNITDRSGMNTPVLVGQNILEKGKFLINPALREHENIDWAAIQDHVNVEPLTEDSREKAKQVYEFLKDSNITFEQLVKYIHTRVVETIDDIKY